MRRSYIRKESYEMHEERNWSYNHPSSYNDHPYHDNHTIKSLDDHDLHHDDGSRRWCGAHHTNKTTTTLLKNKKDDHRTTWGSNPILRPPLGWVAPPPSHQPHHHPQAYYGGGGGGTYEHDGFIDHRSHHSPPYDNGLRTRKVSLDGYDFAGKSQELESLIKELGFNGARAVGPGVKVIELVQIERTRTYGTGLELQNKQWKMTNAYPNEHIFSTGF